MTEEQDERDAAPQKRRVPWWEHAFWIGIGLAVAVGFAGTLIDSDYVGEASALLFLAFAIVLRRLIWAS